jgi:hypothetical protein
MICQSCGSKNVRWNMHEETQCVECRATGDKLKRVVCPCGTCYYDDLVEHVTNCGGLL